MSINIEQNIRRLARSGYYQNLLNASKEIGQIRLFDNIGNLSGLQVYFLHWLQIYESLYIELANQEWKYLDEQVINNDTRTDAFLIWRQKQREIELQKNKQSQKVQNTKLKNKDNVTTYNIDFEG
jgi:hypothetical protein